MSKPEGRPAHSPDRTPESRPTSSAPRRSDTTSERLDHLDNLPACPVCGGHLIEIRQKWQCERCHTICETCCEGSRG